MYIARKLATAVLLTIALASTSLAAKGPLKRAELKEAESRLREMGFRAGPVDGVIDGATKQALATFQKWEGRTVTGRLTRAELNAIRDATPPRPKDTATGTSKLILIDKCSW